MSSCTSQAPSGLVLSLSARTPPPHRPGALGGRQGRLVWRMSKESESPFLPLIEIGNGADSRFVSHLGVSEVLKDK